MLKGYGFRLGGKGFLIHVSRLKRLSRANWPLLFKGNHTLQSSEVVAILTGKKATSETSLLRV